MLESETPRLTVIDLVARARKADARALTSIQSTARYLGLGLANVVNGTQSRKSVLTGEITTAWDLIEGTVREALKERSLTEALAATRVHVASSVENPRLRGASRPGRRTNVCSDPRGLNWLGLVVNFVCFCSLQESKLLHSQKEEKPRSSRPNY